MRKNIGIVFLILIISLSFSLMKETLVIKALTRISRITGDQWIQTSYPIYSKFWVHRTNSLGKLKEFSDKYDGIEMDIIYFEKDKNFDVSHNSNGRIDYPLDSFLQLLSGTENKFWLDFKNLDINNADQSSDVLAEMLQRNHISKNRVIVESPDYNALGVFKAKGFYTSFYCPVYKNYLHTAEGRKLFVSTILKAVDSGNINALSFTTKYYSLVKTANINNIDFLVWGGPKWFGYHMDHKLENLFNDNQVKVILVEDLGRFNR